MDAKQFDAVARTWATASRRQVLLRGLGAVAAVATTLVNKTGPFNLPIAEAATSLSCALQTYPMAGTRFTGARIKADVQFFDTLDTINQCAVEADVQVVITSSFRQGPPAGELGSQSGLFKEYNRICARRKSDGFCAWQEPRLAYAA